MKRVEERRLLCCGQLEIRSVLVMLLRPLRHQLLNHLFVPFRHLGRLLLQRFNLLSAVFNYTAHGSADVSRQCLNLVVFLLQELFKSKDLGVLIFEEDLELLYLCGLAANLGFAISQLHLTHL